MYEDRGKLSPHLSTKGNFLYFENYNVIKVIFKDKFLFVVECESTKLNDEGYAERRVFVKAINNEDRVTANGHQKTIWENLYQKALKSQKADSHTQRLPFYKYYFDSEITGHLINCQGDKYGNLIVTVNQFFIDLENPSKSIETISFYRWLNKPGTKHLTLKDAFKNYYPFKKPKQMYYFSTKYYNIYIKVTSFTNKIKNEDLNRWFIYVCPLTLKMLNSCREIIVSPSNGIQSGITNRDEIVTYTEFEVGVLDFFMNNETGMLFQRDIFGFNCRVFELPTLIV